MRTKAEVERHHDMARAADLWRCADRRCGVPGWLTRVILFEYNAPQERAMPKPTTDENEPSPPGGERDSAAGSPSAPGADRWVLPDNFIDVTAERMGERYTLVGPPQRAKPKG
jgi:hypothetical protein